ncbi:hypothetical protein FRC01_008021 [Tulasnella sp. 417]|nr:hypothetical protein FRC01_008021 [Tulasnella sp. 417]
MIVDFDGREAFSYIVQRGDLNALERLRLIYEAGKAIQYLHSRNPPLVHGALHPKNIFIKEPNSAVLSDFGLANVWRLLEANDLLRDFPPWGLYYAELSPGARIGYIAPEYIWDEEGEMVPSADIYAFASVILAVMSIRHPFAGVSVGSPEWAAAILYGVPPKLEDHPNLPENDTLWPLLQRMWSRYPADRPTIDEVMKQVRLAIPGGGKATQLTTKIHQLDREVRIRSEEALPNNIAPKDAGEYHMADPMGAEPSA